MTSSALIPLLGAIAGACVWMPKWWRVAQREHYLSGSVSSTLLRWVTTTPLPNLGLALLGLAFAASTIFFSGALRVWFAVLTVVVSVIMPVGLPWRGKTSKLRFTRRMKTAAVLSAIIWGVALGLLGWVANVESAAAICSVFGVVAVDTALAVITPLESRFAKRFQRSASERLEAVNPLVVAITGSYGKTSVKEHLATLVGPQRPTVASPASWNNQAGLSRAINEHLNMSTEVFVAEMGTYGTGEIQKLCLWIKPEIVAITAIGPVHLERMGSIDRIVAAKMEIIEAANTVVLNVDSPELAAQAERIAETHRLIRCSGTQDNAADVAVSIQENDTDEAGLRLDYFGESYPISSLHPSVKKSNVAVAAALAVECGVPIDRLAGLIKELAPTQHRASNSVTDAGITIIDNTFNSNPAGAKEALAALLTHVNGGDNNKERRLVVVTPGMVELGKLQATENANFARLVAESGCVLVIVGRTNRRALRHGASLVGGMVVEVRNRDEAREWVRHNLSAGDGVLWENDLPDHYG